MTKTYHKHDKDLQYNLQSTCAHFFECLVIIKSIIFVNKNPKQSLTKNNIFIILLMLCLIKHIALRKENYVKN